MTTAFPLDRARMRLVLALGLAIALAFVLATAAAIVVGMLWPSTTQTLGPVGKLRRAAPQLFSVGNHEFYLAWNDSTPVALSTIDPHSYIRPCAGPIRFDQRFQSFVDPCGGSVYQPDGTYIRGPSPRNMDRFALWIENDNVKVDISRLIPGQPHP